MNEHSRRLLLQMDDSLHEAIGYLVAEDRAPTAKAQAAARECLAQIGDRWQAMRSAEGPPLPEVGTGGDGEVSCDWEHGDRSLAIVFYPDGSTIWVRGRMELGRMVDQVASSDPQPEHLFNAVLWVLEAQLALGEVAG